MLIKLMIGVRRFQGDAFKKMQGFFEHLSMGQNPEILFVTCSDSRLIPSLLTQTNPGELFVIRNVGNIIPPSHVTSSEAAGLVFALTELKSIKDIIICGHSYCGAMKGLLTPGLKEHLPEVSSWLTYSQPALKKLPDSKNFSDLSSKIHTVTKLNIITQLEHLKSYPIVAEKIARKEINLHGWLYEFEKGEVLVYEPQLNEFIPFNKALDRAVLERRDKIIEQTAMNYLESLTHPKTKHEYEELMCLFSRLELHLAPIWPAIKNELIKNLWVELGGLYSNIADTQFSNLVNQGCQLKLGNLKDFQKNIMESQGYQHYMGTILRNSLFSATKNIKTLSMPQDPHHLAHLKQQSCLIS